MPKVGKKKKANEPDFKKAKLKLGKGKKQPSNATDTSFKARSIALPGQEAINRALVEGSTDEPRTALGLSLDDVLARLRHPNAGVRKDCLGSVKELVSSAPTREVGKVLRALGGVIADEDTPVRKTLLALIGWYLPLVPENTLAPHLPLLLLQTSSALSHIFPEIRLSACQLILLLLEHIPKHVVGSWPASSSSSTGSGLNIIEGLRLAIGLGGGNTSNYGLRLTANAKLVTLKTMLSFLECALEGKGHDDRDIENIFADWLDHKPRSRKGKERAIGGDFTVFAPGEEGFLAPFSDWALSRDEGREWELGRLSGDAPSDEATVVTTLSALYVQLQPLLQTTFLEAAPLAFSPSATSLTPASSTETSLELCFVSAALTELLARHIFSATPQPRREVREGVADFLKRMAPYFPFTGPTAQVSSTGVPRTFQLSLAYAGLAVLLAPRHVKLDLRGRSPGSPGRIEATEVAWEQMRYSAKGSNAALSDVADWVADCLAAKKDVLAPPLTSTAYAGLLPIIWALLNLPPPLDDSEDISATVGQAVLSHLSRSASSSSTRSLGDDFLYHLVDVHEQPHPSLPFFLPRTSPLRPALNTWFESLPRVLWELGTKDEIATERLLRFLLHVGHRGPSQEGEYGLFGVGAVFAVAGKLGPFFHLQHPSKGSLPGPWAKLSKPVQRLALDMASVWTQWDQAGSLQSAVQRATTVADADAGWAREYAQARL